MKNHLFATLAAMSLASFEHVETVLKCVALLAAIAVSVLDYLRRSRRKVYPRRKSKPQIPAALLLLLVLGLTGCSSMKTAEVIRALATDTNTVQIKVTSPWGSLEVERNR